MNIGDKIESVISESIRSRGYDIVHVDVSGGSKPVVEVFIERLDGSAVTISDCTLVSRAVSALLDVENIINNSYRLNVSSPGIERPLTKLEHFTRFIGRCATVEMVSLVSNRRKFTGIIAAVKNFKNVPHIQLYLKAEQETIELALADVRKAKLKMDKSDI